ncbi:MAG: choice-of-anchor J domain-containing protein [Candidatus Cloacimonetes bacterium]|jgi:hypothetical protein|nr:choice-of-anchor J domain-containing protein [Candidatus Cloacimonadota bacterium]
MKKIIILLCALAILGIAFADTVTVGSGTATSSNMPITGNYGYSYSQQIYTQAQINKAGDITKIRFYYVSGTITNSKDWVIYMGHTTKTTFATTTDWEPLANLTQVFIGDVSSMVPLANNWMEITLNNAFPYDNVNNLIVAVDENASGFAPMSWGAFTSGTNTGIYYYSDGTNPNPATPPTASSRTATIARAQFVFANTAAPLAPTLLAPANNGSAFTSDKLSWMPTAGGSDVTKYDVYFGVSSTPPLASFEQTGTSFAPTLVAGVDYYWNVVAKNEIGSSPASPTWKFTTITGAAIGDGGITTLNLPLNPYYGYNYSQTLYLQSEINISGKRIEKLYYNWNGSATGTNSKDWTIYMGHTNKTAFASTTDWVPYANMSQVFSGVVTIPATPGWIEITLNAPFVYDNINNLVIAVNETTTGDDGSSAKFFGTSFVANRGLRLQNDTAAYNPASPGTGTLVAGIANIKMMFGDIPLNGVLVVNPSPVACGSSYVGVQKRVTVSLSNTGGAAFDVSSIALDDYTNFQLGTLPTFPITLNPAAAPVTFDVIFTPTAAGALTANLLIGDTRNNSSIVVSGTGVASQVGEICENPYVATLPIVDYAGTTVGFADDYTSAMFAGTSSSYHGGYDWVAKVTVPTLGALTVSVANPVGNTTYQYLGVFLVNTIPSLASPATVLGTATTANTTATISSVTVAAGTYYIIVDNWPTPNGVDFVLNASFASASNPPSPAVLVAPTPTGVTGIATNPTLSWTSGGGIVEKYFVSYGTQSPFTTIVDNFDNGMATTYGPLPILAYSTEYWWTVTPWNSVGGNATGVTPWTFTTISNPTISIFPYIEGFEVPAGTLPANWTVTEGAAGASQHWKAAAAAASHGPAAPAVGSSFAWLYCYLASTTYNPYSMITPPIALDATPKRLTYQYWIGTDTVLEPLFVDISTDMATWTTLYTHSNAANTLAWHENIIGLGAYASSTVYLRFRGVSSYANAMTDLGIDNVIVANIPSGPPTAPTLTSPVALTGMPKAGFNMTWTPDLSSGPTDYYNVYLWTDEDGFGNGPIFYTTGTSLDPTAPPLDPLGNPQSGMTFAYLDRYNWTVEAYSAAYPGEEAWPTGSWFEIEDDPSIVIPPAYLENFDALAIGAMPNNWTMFGPHTWKAASNVDANSMPNCAVVYYNSYDDKDDWMITPPIRMVASQLYTISFALKAPGWDGVPEALAVHFGSAPTIVAMNANTPIYDDNNLFQADWTTIQVPFTPATTGTYYFGWHAYSDADIDYIAVDDISIFIPAAIDMAVTGLSGKTTGFVGSPVTKTVTVANVGATTISSYTVYLKNAVGDAVLDQETISAPILAAGTASHELSWIPALDGIVSVYAEVSATGDLVATNNVSAPVDVTVYPASMKLLYVGDPATTWVSTAYPFNMYWEDFVAESVYLASEIQASAGTIKAISYINYFATAQTKQVQIWMQNTSQSTLSAGWLPWANYTLVFDGMVNFPVGANEINIPITPFTYTGGNLAIRTSRTWEGDWVANNQFFVTNNPNYPNRSRYYYADSEFVDESAPGTGYLSTYVPNILFYVDPATLVLTTATPDVAVSENAGAITLAWDAVPYAYSYNLYKSTDPYAFGATPESTIYTNSFSYTPLAGETKAFYKVASATYRDYVRSVMAKDYVSTKNAGDLKQVETIQVPKLRNRKTQQ